MDDGDGRPPISLTRNAPVAQAILRLANAPALGLCARDDIGLRLINRHTIHPARIDDCAGACESNIAAKAAIGHIAIGDNAGDGQIIFAGKIKVALVMRGAAKDGASAIVHQHEVRDIDRQMPACIERMFDGQACIKPPLFSGFNVGSSRSALATFLDKRLQIGGIGGQLLRDGVVCGNGNKACAEHRIRPRCKHVDAAIPPGETEGAFQALRFADPVFLHQPHLVRPLVKRTKASEQFICKVGDFEEPLAQLAAFNWRAGAPALAVDDLFIGEHGHVNRVPVYRRFFAIDQASGI